MKDTLFSSILKFNSKGILREFRNPIVMGILNATPDSFYAESRIQGIESAMTTAQNMIKDGAEILDIGGYSSRPGAVDISETEEIDRILPLILELKLQYPDTLISVDTFRSSVAEKALEAGADLINDISGGLLDSKILDVAAKFHVPYILMHLQGTPQNMLTKNQYTDLLPDIMHYFSIRVNKAKAAGVNDIILDPGFGFSKNREQNFELLRKLETLNLFELPLLIGVSRKSMIYKSLAITPQESLNGTTVLNTLALERGAKILRVHDVRAAKGAIDLVGLTLG